MMWKENIESALWDKWIVQLGGHPLQSAYWGNARKTVDHIENCRLVALLNDQPIGLASVETRVIRGIKIAWMPKGPIFFNQQEASILLKQLAQYLHQQGFACYATYPWEKITIPHFQQSCHYTIWINLSVGKDCLFKNLDKNFRYYVNRYKRIKHITIEQTHCVSDVLAFFELCRLVSVSKRFTLNVSSAFMLKLLERYTHSHIEAQLFIARYQQTICAGAFIMRCGKHIHYLWGASDRRFANQQASQALHWHVMEWALEKNCTLYDLEGINIKKNFGTFAFKKKLGGEIVALPKVKLYAAQPLYQPIAWLFNGVYRYVY